MMNWENGMDIPSPAYDLAKCKQPHFTPCSSTITASAAATK